MDERKHCIYMHRNKINNKVYIGQTKNIKNRWYPSLYKQCTYFYNAILKYGWNNFEHIILEENLTQEEANQKEQEYIKQYHSLSTENGYNLLDGGGNGCQYNDHNSHPNNKQVICLETQKIYLSMKQAAQDTGVNYKNISQACTGEKKTAGGYHWSYYVEGYKYPIPEKKKKIKCIETNQVFNNCREAARALCLQEIEVTAWAKGIGRVCKGEFQSTHGYHFMYVTE